MKTVKRRYFSKNDDKFRTIEIRRDENAKYFYHITEDNWGDSVVLRPRNYGSNRGDLEPEISRICVAPSVELCFCAVRTYDKVVNVYRTKSKVKGYSPVEVCDSRITGEKWIIRPTKFVKVWTLPKKVVKKIINMSIGVIFGGDEYDRKIQSRYKSKLLKYMKNIEKPSEAMK